MWLFKLTIVFMWVSPGPLVETDGHQVELKTTSAQVTLDGFANQAACIAYAYKPPLTLTMPDGTQVPVALTEKSRSCAGYKP